MQRFKSARHAQRFLSAHGRIHNHFQLRRHRLSATAYRTARDAAFRTWREITGVASAACGPDQPRSRGVDSTINLTTPFGRLVGRARDGAWQLLQLDDLTDAQLDAYEVATIEPSPRWEMLTSA